MASNSSRSPGAGKTSAKKSATPKAATKSSRVKKTAGSASDDGTTDSASSESSDRSSSRRGAAKSESRPPRRASQIAASAAEELADLTGKGVEGVTGLERTDDGWTVQVEVVEVRRIPDTTDVLALYEITADEQGELLGYRRIRRYARGVPGND